MAEVPDGIAWEYFQAAPPDQQTDHLRGGEWLVLDGLHPTLARVQTRLPTARGAARVLVRRPGAAPAEHVVELACDTLAIDGENQLISKVWRGRHEVVGGEAALSSLTVLAGLDAPGALIDWPTLARFEAAPASGAAPAVAKDAAPAEETLALGSEQAAAVAQRAIAPFQVAAPGARGASAAVAGAPWSGIAAATVPRPSAGVGEETMAVGDPLGPLRGAPPSMIAAPCSAMPPVAAPPTPVASPARPAPKAGPLAAPELIAEKLRAAGASHADVAALLLALRPHPPHEG